MEAELELAKRLITAQSGKTLDHLPLNILRGALEGKSLSEIAESYPCSENYAKEVSAKLCKYLSVALGKRVTKKNLRPLLTEHLQLEKLNPAPVVIPVQEIVVTPAALNSNFVGREVALAELQTKMKQGAKVIVIQAPGGVGKTTLAQEFLSSLGFEVVLDLPMAKEEANITPVESVIEEWLKRDFGEEPGRDFGVMLGRLKRQLQTKRVGVLIDNLEPALDGQGKFIAPHRRYVELLRVLADASVKSLTLITSREPLAEGLSISSYPLPSLGEEAWANFFGSRGLEIEATILKEIHRAYGGNALAMTILCDPIQRDGGMGAYWQEHKIEAGLLVELAVENLVKEQFDRLEKISPEAYRLLCRLGCYRYQDVPTVPTEGLLCLLWDVPEERRRQVIKFLQNWSLVEWDKEGYWLHPIIRKQAINRLRASEDWKTTNHKAAEFWTESVKTIETIKDAIIAFEAYYQYISIKDFESAGEVIVFERENSYFAKESLGSSCWRLGLLQQVISAIFYVKDKVNNLYYRSNLNLHIGYASNLVGDIHQALIYHEESRKLANQGVVFFSDNKHNKSDSLFLLECQSSEIVSLINIGCCYIDLWELDLALDYFKKCFLVTFNTKYHRFSVNSIFCLAWLYSCLNIQEKALELARKAYEQVEASKTSSWSYGYLHLYLGLTYKNLGEREMSFKMYHRAMVYAEESHYTQVKAKALTGLSELCREQEDFKTALFYHEESIELLEKIGAKCDLAEAYYQLALTYQAMGEPDQSQEYFTKAIQLYEEMEAPKQVEKVRRSIPPSPP